METSKVTPIPKSSSFRVIVLGSCGVLLVFAVSSALVWAQGLRIQRQRSQLAQTSALGPRVVVMRVQKPPLGRRIPIPASIHGCSPSAQVGQFLAIEEVVVSDWAKTPTDAANGKITRVRAQLLECKVTKSDSCFCPCSPPVPLHR